MTRLAEGAWMGRSRMIPQAWVRQELARLAGGEPGYSTVHLDELGWGDLSWPGSVAALLDAAEALPQDWWGRLSLALPLLDSDALCTGLPSDPRSVADLNVPPPLYLFAPGHLARGTTNGEVFFKAVPPVAGLENPALRFELASLRNADAVKYEWEFGNTLWVHFLPAVR